MSEELSTGRSSRPRDIVPADVTADQPSGATRVSTLELFFDLVFVFTITQLTSLLARALTWRTVWHAVVILGLVYWMYDGYAWLTNAVPARGGSRQALLLGGMAGYLVLAIAIPDAFSRTGLTFGIAYLVIIAIHAFLYVTAAAESSSLAMRALAPWNLGGALVVLVAGAVGGVAQEVAWTAIFALLWFGTRPRGGFEIEPAHFVERHGLLVIVAIGESVVATGIGARGLAVNLSLVAVAVLGLLLSVGFWWAYFGDDDEGNTIEAAFARATGPQRPRVAFFGFGYAHYAMLLGIVLTAVGLRQAVARPGDELVASYAFALAAGPAIFLLAHACFHAILGLRRLVLADLLKPALLLAVIVGAFVSAGAGLTAVVAGFGALLLLDRSVADVSA